MPYKPTLPAIRFWRYVDKSGECWLWTGASVEKGYGRFFVSKSAPAESAHRVAWELTYGSIPEGLWVLHRCDNPGCVRPDHLFLGTHLDNMADMRAKNRAGKAFGERHYSAKLTEASVYEIRRLAASGMGHHVLSRRFGVCDETIRKCVLRLTWARVA